MEEYDYNHPEHPDFANRQTQEVTQVTFGEDDVLYIHVDLDGRDYPQKTLHKIVDNVKKTFENELPNAKIVVGFMDLTFTVITKKQAFKEKVAGTVK